MENHKVSVHAPDGLPAKMVTEYVNRCRVSLPGARTMIDGPDAGSMKVFGHKLKGTGRAYGIPVMSEIGAVIEQAAVRGDGAELRAQVDLLEAYLGRLEIVSD